MKQSHLEKKFLKPRYFDNKLYVFYSKRNSNKQIMKDKEYLTKLGYESKVGTYFRTLKVKVDGKTWYLLYRRFGKWKQNHQKPKR